MPRNREGNDQGMTLEPFFRAAPWALPGTALAGLGFAFLALPLARKLCSKPTFAWLYGTAVSGFLTLTVSPSHSIGSHGSTSFAFNVRLPSLHELSSTNTDSLNVSAGVAVCGATALLAKDIGHSWPIVLAIALPIGAELSQWALPALGRSGFSLSDVIANEIGIVAGAILGLLVYATLPSKGLRKLSGQSTRR